MSPDPSGPMPGEPDDQTGGAERAAVPESPRGLIGRAPEWLRGEGEANDVVLSSRVRLARNLAGYPFCHRADRQTRADILSRVHAALDATGVPAPGGRVQLGGTLWVDLASATKLERQLLVERLAISRQLAKGRYGRDGGGPDEPRGVALSVPGERAGVLVNEEDHIRIQAVRSGLALDDALAEADGIDDALESKLDFAFNARFGYLTACPTNVGTGIRFGVMLHLPGLRITGEVEKVRRAAADISLAVRGFHGEGSETLGDLYQISNQTTLGKSESVLLGELSDDILPNVIGYERRARQQLMENRRPFLEDLVHRALGVLLHARLLTAEEAMQQLSLVRLGVDLGLVAGDDEVAKARVRGSVHELFVLSQPAHLQQSIGEALEQDRRRAVRATLVRDRLAAALGAG